MPRRPTKRRKHPTPGKRRSFRSRFKALPWWLRYPLAIGAITSVLALVTGITLFIIYGQIAKKFDLADLGKMPERSVVYDVRGKILGRLHGENRTVVPLGKISPHFIDALLAREDSRFRDHGGVDYVGVLRAFVRNVKDRRFVQGASTITMQLARNSYGMTERTLHRKLVEIMLARRIESEFTKDEILELYINRIFFGGGIFGLELASQTYFGKPASSLTLAESAMVAGIIRSPNRFSPAADFEAACRERDDVLARMLETGSITTSEADAAKKAFIRVMPGAMSTSQENYALDVVRKDLDLVLAENNVEDGGLTIYTTVDADLQQAAENSLESHIAQLESAPDFPHLIRDGGDGKSRPALPDGTTDYLQGAVVIIDNRTGGIAATVGGRDLGASPINHSIQDARQTGNAFRPFVYAAAYDRGMLPGTLVEDGPIRPDEFPDGPVWNPKSDDLPYLGSLPLEDGLFRSRNSMTSRVGNSAGLGAVSETASTAGIPAPENPSSQIFLSGVPADVKNLTSAFTIFPNNGQRRRPFIIDRIEDAAGNLIYRSGVIDYPVISPSAASLTDRALRKSLGSKGTGSRVRDLGFKAPAGGIPGTSVGGADAWFVGYSDRLTCGVWVGFDDKKNIGIPGAGVKIALPIWTDIMKRGQQFGYQAVEFTARPATREVGLCRINGRLSTYGCKRHGHAYTDALPESALPTNRCRLHDGPTQRPLRGGSNVR